MDHTEYEGLSRALFEESDDALILFDADTRQILDVNAAAQRLCGIGIRDLLNTPVATAFQSSGPPGLVLESLPLRKANLTFSQYGIRLRVFERDCGLPVDLTVARLAVKPRPLVLVTIRAADQAARGIDALLECQD
jgi:nitrogen-specific signal transduction histidine kinase